MSRAVPPPKLIPQDAAIPPGAVALVLVLAAGWGANAPALRYSLHYLPPLAAAGIRFGVGLLVVAFFAWRQGVPLLAERSEWRPLAWMAALFLVQIALLNYGSAHTEGARQALLINSYPLFVPLLAHRFLPDDRLTGAKAVGTVLAFAGLLAVFGERAVVAPAPSGGWRPGLLGDALVAASAVLLAAKAVYTRALVRRSHPYQVLSAQMIGAVPLFFLASLLWEPQEYRWSPAVAASVLYQGVVVAGLCFIGWTSLLRHHSPSRLSVGFFLTPVFGAWFSHLALGEPLTGGLLTGGAAILAGLFVVNRRRERGA